MKKIILFLLLILTGVVGNAQTSKMEMYDSISETFTINYFKTDVVERRDYEPIFGLIKSEKSIHISLKICKDGLVSPLCLELKELKVCRILGFNYLENELYYKVGVDDKVFYIHSNNVEIPDEYVAELNKLELFSLEDQVNYFCYSKFVHNFSYNNKINRINEYKRNGLVVIKANPYENIIENTGMKIIIYNTSPKTIKYVTFSFVGYNRVDDPVYPWLSSSYVVIRKGIGPIYQYEGVEYDFSLVWDTDIVEYSKLKSIKLQYTDGTTKIINNKNVLEPVGEDDFNLNEDDFKYVSIVKELLPNPAIKKKSNKRKK